MAVVLMLAVLVGVALPRFVDATDEADLAVQKATIGALQEAYQGILIGYAAGATGLPPDADSNGYPDTLGDAVAGEPTLFDELLWPPVPNDDSGWTTYAAFPFPHLAGTLFMYHYDADGDNVHDAATEALVIYNNDTGVFAAFPP